MDFTDIISKGSLATQLRCDGIFSNRFIITNFPQNVSVKKIENRATFGGDMDKSLRRTFWAPVYLAFGPD